MILVVSMVLTILFETAVILVIYPKKRKEYAWNSVLINAFTNPVMNLFLTLSGRNTSSTVFVCECIVILTEAFLWKKLTDMSPRESFLLSLVCNIISVLLGGILYAFLF